MTSKLPSHMHPCSQQLNYNPSSYHLHASFMAKFILCGRTHTLSYIPYCASCYFSGFLTDIYTPIHTPARPHNVLHSSSNIYHCSIPVTPFSSILPDWLLLNWLNFFTVSTLCILWCMLCCSFFASQGSLALVPVGMWQIIIIIIIIIIYRLR